MKLYEKWFRQTHWHDEYEIRLRRCQRRAELILSTFKETAACKLLLLTDCEKEGTARQACLDILDIKMEQEEKTEDETVRKMKPETQEAILKIMAGEKKNNGEK